MLVYGIVIRLFYVATAVAGIFNIKARKWITGRKGWKARLLAQGFEQNKWVWFHASSFGEFQDGKSLMEAYKRRHPDTKILLTFFSSTGYELQHECGPADAVHYLPLDTQSNATWFLEVVKPVAALFIRHDIWPNFVTACAARNIKVYLVSFTLNSGSTFLNFPLKGFYRKVFNCYTCIFVQYPRAGKLLQQHGFNSNLVVSGNARMDRVIDASREDRRYPQVEAFVAGGFCCLAGSTHAHDRRVFLEAVMMPGAENMRWIIVPHEIDPAEIKEAQRVLKNKMT